MGLQRGSRGRAEIAKNRSGAEFGRPGRQRSRFRLLTTNSGIPDLASSGEAAVLITSNIGESNHGVWVTGWDGGKQTLDGSASGSQYETNQLMDQYVATSASDSAQV